LDATTKVVVSPSKYADVFVGGENVSNIGVAVADKVNNEKGYLWVQTKGRCSVRGTIAAGEMAYVVSGGVTQPVSADTNVAIGLGVQTGVTASVVDVDFY
jgi:hypothetical protein